MPGAAADDTAAAPPYTVVLTRPAHVGETASFRGRLTESAAFLFLQDGKPVAGSKSAYREVSYVVRVTVLKVAGNGREVHERATLKTFLGRTSPTAPLKTLSVAGATIDATLSPKVVLKRTDGKPIPAGDLSFLRTIFARTDSDTAEDDDSAFGPPGPVSVGDEWQANHAALAAGLGRSLGVTVPEDHVTSTVTLARTEKINGATCLDVRGHILVGAVPMPLPPQAQIVQPALATLKGEMTKTVTADPSGPELASSEDYRLTASGAAQRADGAVLTAKIVASHHGEITRLPGK